MLNAANLLRPPPPHCSLAADGKMTWLIDFVGYNSKNSPPIKVSLQVLNILQVGGWRAWRFLALGGSMSSQGDAPVQAGDWRRASLCNNLRGGPASSRLHAPRLAGGMPGPSHMAATAAPPHPCTCLPVPRTTSLSAWAAPCRTAPPPSSTSCGAPCRPSSTPSPATSSSSSPQSRP